MGVEFCQVILLHLLRWSWDFSVLLITWCITSIGLWMMNCHCVPGINPTWSHYMILLICCWIWFVNILLRIFKSIFVKATGLKFLFFSVAPLFGFGNKVMVLSGFPGGWDSEESVWNAADPGSIPGSGRSSGKGNGNPLQYFCLENSMDKGAWRATVRGVTKSRKGLSN